MAEPRPFQFDSRQRSVGAGGGKRRIAWPWIALSLAVHGAIILFALMGAARAECDLVIVSLFVNPTQFGAGEDYERYPRDEGTDAAFATDHGVDLLFAPGVDEMYPPGFAVSIDPGPVAEVLCGRERPGHFAGVATVVARLLGIVRPEAAYFGLKDYLEPKAADRVPQP